MSSKPISEYDSNSMSELPSPSNCKKKATIVGVVILCLAALVATYFWDPTFHGFVNNTLSKIQSMMSDVHLSVAQALLYITLPLGGVALAIGCIAHIHRTHKTRLKDNEMLLDDGKSSLLYTLKEMQPTVRELTIAAIAMATLILIGIGGFAVFQYVPHANQWINQIFSHPLQLWQALSYVGGATAGTALMIGLIIHMVQSIKASQEQQRRMEGIQNVE